MQQATTARRRSRRDGNSRVVVGNNKVRKVCAVGIGLAALLAVLQLVI